MQMIQSGSAPASIIENLMQWKQIKKRRLSDKFMAFNISSFKNTENMFEF